MKERLTTCTSSATAMAPRVADSTNHPRSNMKPKKIIPMTIINIAMALATITLHFVATISINHALVNLGIMYITAMAIVTQEVRKA